MGFFVKQVIQLWVSCIQGWRWLDNDLCLMFHVSKNFSSIYCNSFKFIHLHFNWNFDFNFVLFFVFTVLVHLTIYVTVAYFTLKEIILFLFNLYRLQFISFTFLQFYNLSFYFFNRCSFLHFGTTIRWYGKRLPIRQLDSCTWPFLFMNSSMFYMF